MAFLGSVGKFFHDAIRNPVVQVALPVVAFGGLTLEKGLAGVTGRQGASFLDKRPVGMGNAGIEASRNRWDMVPGQYDPYGQYAPAYSVYFQEPGVMAWDSSTGSAIFSQTTPMFSTAPPAWPQATSWEDLLAQRLNQP